MDNWITVGFVAYLVVVLLLPLVSKRIEDNSEVFYLASGIVAVILSMITGNVVETKEIDLLLNNFS